MSRFNTKHIKEIKYDILTVLTQNHKIVNSL